MALGAIDAGSFEAQGGTGQPSLISGLFYGVDRMRVGGTRRLEIAPHLASGNCGVPGVIPPGALLTAAIAIDSPAAAL